MKRWWLALMLLIVGGAARADEAQTLRALLDEFLAGASRNDAAMHDRFWADDLVYTGSGGKRRGKAELMADVRAPVPPEEASQPTPAYSAEDVSIRLYGDAAVVAFRLVARTPAQAGAETAVEQYFNTGTFLRRDGRWQAVAWQATRIPPP
jgi:ketosteroid isomerase-like protein